MTVFIGYPPTTDNDAAFSAAIGEAARRNGRTHPTTLTDNQG